ncbi:hypothetical protein F4703DRAFT_1380706 [Phycomyces blakesleeanus]
MACISTETENVTVESVVTENDTHLNKPQDDAPRLIKDYKTECQTDYFSVKSKTDKLNAQASMSSGKKGTPFIQLHQRYSRSYQENCTSLSPKTGRTLMAKVKSFEKSNNISKCVDEQKEKPSPPVRRFSENVIQSQYSLLASKLENVDSGLKAPCSPRLNSSVKDKIYTRFDYEPKAKELANNLNIRTKGKVLSAISVIENSQKISPVSSLDESIKTNERFSNLKVELNQDVIPRHDVPVSVVNSSESTAEKLETQAEKPHLLAKDIATSDCIPVSFAINCSEDKTSEKSEAQSEHLYSPYHTSPPISPPRTPSLTSEKSHGSLERKSTYLPLLSPRLSQDNPPLDTFMLDTLFPSAGCGKGQRRVSFSPIVATIPQLTSGTDSAFSSVSSGKSIENVVACTTTGKNNEDRHSVETTRSFWKAFSTEMTLEKETTSKTQKFIPGIQKPVTFQQVFQQLAQIPSKAAAKEITTKEHKSKMNLWKRYRSGADKGSTQNEPQQVNLMPQPQVKMPSLVHRTKTRPKKPSSFRKNHRFHVSGVAMPVAAARPDWREKIKES